MALTLINELIRDMPEDDYHASTGLGEGKFITRSMIVDYAKDPASFHLKHIVGHPLMQFKGNNGTKFGNYIEAHILDKNTSKYVVRPDTYVNDKKEVKKWSGNATVCKDWMRDNPDVVTENDVELAQFLERRFKDTALGQWWLNQLDESEMQVVVRWSDPDTGLPMQIRIDNYMVDVFLTDLKSTGKSLERFSDAADDYGYHFQDAIYSEGHEIVTGKRLPFLFAIAETTGLKRARIRQLHPTQVSYASREYHKALSGIKAGNYAAYDATEETAQHCELAAYQLYKYESED